VSKRPPRTTAEWTTFAVAVAVLLAIMAAIGVEAAQHHEEADPVAAIEGTRRVDSRFHVSVVVENRGDKAAAAVQVVASLVVGGETLEGDQTVDFLAGGDEEELVFVFDQNPDDGDLSVDVSGFTVP
jgi:uncharacterized protein (TIGR02588 family)